jgi:hypothetical protein
LPLRITLLLWLVLIITALNLVRMFTAMAWRQTLESYLPGAVVTYIAVSGASWVLAGLFVLWYFWRGGRRTRTVFLLAAGSYGIWIWADRLIMQPHLLGNWQFELLATALLIGFTAAVVTDPHNQTYFRKETYERKPEEQSSP